MDESDESRESTAATLSLRRNRIDMCLLVTIEELKSIQYIEKQQIHYKGITIWAESNEQQMEKIYQEPNQKLRQQWVISQTDKNHDITRKIIFRANTKGIKYLKINMHTE